MSALAPSLARRLTCRFLALPFRYQIKLARDFQGLPDDWEKMGEQELFLEVFKRVSASGKLNELLKKCEQLIAEFDTKVRDIFGGARR